MLEDKELEIQRLFLDEAQEHLATLELALLGLASSRVDTQAINAALRATHSIKGGAAMMGFHLLSDLSHHLENFFKVLKTQRQSIAVNAELEHLLLSGVDCLRYVIETDRVTYLKGDCPNPETYQAWLENHSNPIFNQLHQQLGESDGEDAASVLSSEDGQDILPVVFETEVEGCLQRLEAVLETPDQRYLLEEVTVLAQELGGLGEMLQLPAFSQLCESITDRLRSNPDAIAAIAESALHAWRQSQALVLKRQFDQLPTAIAGCSDHSDQRAFSVDYLIDQLKVPIDALIEDFSLEYLSQSVDQDLEQPLNETFNQSLTDQLDESAYQLIDEESNLYSIAHPFSSIEENEVQEILINDVIPSTRQTRIPYNAQATHFKVLDNNSDGFSTTVFEEDPDATVRVPLKQLNQLNDLLGELAIERNALDLYLKRLRNLSRTLKQRVQILDRSHYQMQTDYKRPRSGLPILAPGLDVSAYSTHLSKAIAPLLNLTSNSHSGFEEDFFQQQFDSLEMDCYDDYDLLSQQMIETIVQLQEVTEDIELGLDDAEQSARSWNKTTKQMQANLSQVRMRPLSDITDRFPRALRELCLHHNKQATLNVLGGTTLIDRNILEALNDPLTHLLRNAFDHGIEDPSTRLAHGKPESGTISIQASHQGNCTLITVSDDGNGIPIEKIRTKAGQMGLDQTLLATASDEDLLSLIFEPGFSTVDQVTALSGRGVGMDVVRDSLKQVRGGITVSTQAGIGTTFTISLPFTLSVVRVLLVESNGISLAIPTDTIHEMIVLEAEQVLTTAGSEVFAWGKEIVQLVVLSRWLKFHCARQPIIPETAPSINVPTVLIVKQGNQSLGIQVDRCWGEQEIAVRRVEGKIPMPPGFTNCTIMGNGQVVPLLDMPDLLHWIASNGWVPIATTHSTHFRQPSLPPAAAMPKLLPPTQKVTILIIDDSINIRRFLALTLEKAGYEVEQAKDGQDALEQLQRGLPVQAVFCDIEMPHLDGYGFLRKVKAISHLAHLPIIMLTSRSSTKHRQLAMGLGATAYFSKPFNEQALLRRLEEILGIHLPV